MFARLRLQGLFIAGFVFAACTAWAQLAPIEGIVLGEDGAPLKGAVVKFHRTDIRGEYQTKTDKRGHYIYVGLQLGTYKISVEVDGKERDYVDGVKNHSGPEPLEVDFNLQTKARQVAALNQAAETGQFTKEQERGLSAEQKAAVESQMKERQKTASKNKALNDAFNAGRAAATSAAAAAAAMRLADAVTQYTEAVTQFGKAADMDPSRGVVWSNMAESYVGLGDAQTAAADKQAAYDKGVDAYKKAIAVMPDDGALHNNFGNLLAKMNRIDDAKAELQTAATLDPASAAKYYYNIGVVLTNINQPEAAGGMFKKAIDTDPNYAKAQYQYALYLYGKVPPPGPDGKVVPPPGLKEALQKYLELSPNGSDAEPAKALLDSLSVSVQTTYQNPNAQKPTGKKK